MAIYRFPARDRDVIGRAVLNLQEALAAAKKARAVCRRPFVTPAEMGEARASVEVAFERSENAAALLRNFF